MESEDHDEDCQCAACDTLIMRADEEWRPTPITDGRTGRCVFCRRTGPLDYYTRLGMSVGFCCSLYGL